MLFLASGDRISDLSRVECNTHRQQKLVTEKGTNIRADLVFNCTGLRPNTSFTKKILGNTIISKFF